jgi:hypothetical protein
MMSNLPVLLSLLALYVFQPFQSRTALAQADILARAETAIKLGQVNELLLFVNDPVEINLEDQKKKYSKTQAEFVLRDFFSKYPAVDFHYDHRTKSRGGMEFTIGTYQYKGGRFRVHMLLKHSENLGEYRIDLLDFMQD